MRVGALSFDGCVAIGAKSNCPRRIAINGTLRSQIVDAATCRI